MKQHVVVLLIALGVFATETFGQLTIETCQEKARNNYPAIAQYGLLAQLQLYSIANSNKAYLPQVALYAKASYQSDVTEFNGMKLAPNDQYMAYAEVAQTLWDGGKTHAQKDMLTATTHVEQQKVEADLYAVKDRVNQLFFGSLLLNEQLVLNESLQHELQTNYERVKAYVAGGIANQSDLDMVRVEQLKNTQRRAELRATQNSFTEMLMAMIGNEEQANEPLVKPTIPTETTSTPQNNRPELLLFDAQRALYDSQKNMYHAANLPYIGLFGQAGYGKPGLNMLDADFASYYIVGARLSWNFGNMYTHKNNMRGIELNKQRVDVQKETFLYNTELALKQQRNEIIKIQEQIQSDDEIIALRTAIRKTAEVKVANGTLSVSELLTKLTEENMAIQDKLLHEILLLKADYDYKYTLNN